MSGVFSRLERRFLLGLILLALTCGVGGMAVLIEPSWSPLDLPPLHNRKIAFKLVAAALLTHFALSLYGLIRIARHQNREEPS